MGEEMDRVNENLEVLSSDGFLENCAVDLAKYCVEVIPGNGRLINCLLENQDNLEGQCLSFFQGKLHFQDDFFNDFNYDYEFDEEFLKLMLGEEDDYQVYYTETTT